MIRSRCFRSLPALLIFLSGGASTLCGTPASEHSPHRPLGENLSYDLAAPDTVMDLPKDLKEISGLTWLGDARLGAVNDEDGKVFVLESTTGAIVDETKFAGDGDYEGLERVSESVFVLRSDGKLFEIRPWTSNDRDTDKHKTDLKKSCDAEGLAYDAATDGLLIACKEYPGKKLRGKKSIYRYSLRSGEMVSKPVLVIDALDAALTPPEGAVSRSMRRLFKLPRFKPSGIAVHPLTGNLYVVSSRSLGLAVFSPDGRLLHSSFLSADVFPQPEGITFAPDGTLYISTEGRSGPARLARFSYRAEQSG